MRERELRAIVTAIFFASRYFETWYDARESADMFLSEYPREDDEYTWRERFHRWRILRKVKVKIVRRL